MIPRERAATSQSRGDKSWQPNVATIHADVSGLMSEEEWLSLLEAEQEDRDVGDILAELLDRVMDGCLKADVVQQLVPFVVAQARDAILHIAQWRFLARDEGDLDLKDEDGTWQEDEEPEPLTTDSWAQGCVPTQHACLSPAEGEVSGAQNQCQQGRQDPLVVAETVSPQWSIQVTSTSAILPVPGSPRPESLPDKVAIAPWSPKGKSPHAESLPFQPARPLSPCPSPGQPEQRWYPLWSPHRDAEGSSKVRVSSHMPLHLSPSCASVAMMHPGPKQKVPNTTPGVPRLGSHCRPERWIWPQVEVLDPKAKPLAHPYGARWHSRSSEPGSPRLPRGPVPMRRTQLQAPRAASLQPTGHLPKPLGSAWLAPGVTIRWGTSVKQEVKEEEEEEKAEEAKQDLRPIHPAVPLPAIAARQVTGEGKD
ncbi:uncharacterized protein C2orf81 homolog [Pogoniulus pusillus]|uniref:uncharacterized protein C2orf81 homolog n=1 Tax=Pogoniulus pusillus TaxID=488313 RepID=UPI0030B9918A